METGNYYLARVSYMSIPPVSRPLGVGENPAEVVVLPFGTPPPEVSYDIPMVPIVYWDCFNHAVAPRKASQRQVHPHDWG